MADQKVVGELIYKIKGDGTEYDKVINEADAKTTKLGATVGTVSDGMIKNLAGAYLGWQGFKKAIDLTIGSAVSYEDAFAGVRKTVEGTEEQLSALSAKFRELSKEIPITAEEFAKIGELAGQLGVPIQNIDSFAKTIAMVGTSTNLTTEQASTDFARFANIMQMPLENVGRLGSTIVELGNNLATTETEIDNMALRIAGAGATLGLTAPQVLGWAGALSSVGIEAEAGGSSMSRLMIEISAVSSEGGKALEKFAKVAGMSAKDFQKRYKEDANGALLEFFGGLQKINNSGGDLIGVLNGLGITEVRQRDAVLRLVGAGDVLNKSMGLSNEGWEKNNALQIEAEKRYKTTASQIQLMKNNLGDLGRQLGTVVLPIVNTGIKFFIQMADVVEFSVVAIKNSVKIMANGIAMALVGSIEVIEKFINGAIDLTNSFLEKVGLEKKFENVSLVSDELANSVKYLSEEAMKAGEETKQAFFKAGNAGGQLSGNLKDLADAQTLLNGTTKENTGEFDDLVNSIKDSGKASEDAKEEAEKLAENYKKLGGNVEDLAYTGKQAITELMESNVKDLEKIEEKIASLRLKLSELKAGLTSDLANQDIGIAEKIVEEEQKIAELKNKIKEEKEKKDGGDPDTILSLQADLLARETALKNNAELEAQLSAQIDEARRRAKLTDIERSIEDYIAEKAQIQQEYDDKKLKLENELLLEEENKAVVLALLQDKQDQINQIIELGNKRFQDLANNRVKMTEDEVTKQITWYNKLADSIAKSKSATRTAELPQFHQGGYVATGGEVHAGEYVIPANMVNAYGGLIKALDSVRNGGSNVNNSIVMNNNINEQIDMEAVLKSISFELNK